MNQLQSNDIIDMRCDLHAIRKKFGERYFASEDAIQEAASLWGASCNRHGVLDNITEKVRVEHKGYSATIRLYRTGKGYWHVARDFNAPDSGSGGPATVWDGIAFKNALAARRWAVQRLLERCDKQERYDRNPALGTFRHKLEAEMTPQLALF